ncbi:glutathione S-transferase family protein [Sandarakinorhabdus oryzae]|uniref:glutathione S-transferase family protein n=1 Tax=Sandarakinorhabdus oryzae TaxID=2675220 RepID=UPI0012E2F0B3|nr:glutathione S-transferase family protein [Sandarakinorhabdus oryzae]
MIIVHHLNNSRSQRILWLLEELGTPYEIKHYSRDAVTNLAPPELKAVHPLGKSPVIEESGKIIFESAAITDWIIRKHGNGRLMPTPGTDAHEDYLMWLHFAEGSAMTPFLLALYTARLGEAAAPLQPRIQEQIGAHVAYFSQCLGGNDWLVNNELSGADIMMSFIAEIATVQGLGAHFPNVAAYAKRLQSRPAWIAAAAKTEPYNFRLPG